MTGTGRRRKPSSEDEEPRPPEEAPATTWSTYAPPPEPDYSYDWRRDSAASQPIPAQPPFPSDQGGYPQGGSAQGPQQGGYARGGYPQAGPGQAPQPQPGYAQSGYPQADSAQVPPSQSAFPQSGYGQAPSSSPSPQFDSAPFDPTPFDSAQGPPGRPSPSPYSGPAQPSSAQFPSAQPSSPYLGAAQPSSAQFPPAPPAPSQYPSAQPPSPHSQFSSAFPSAPAQPTPPAPAPSAQAAQAAPQAQPPSSLYPKPASPYVPPSSPPVQPEYRRPASDPPPLAQGVFAPRTFEQPAPYLPDGPATGEYSPAGFQPSRYSPPSASAASAPTSAPPSTPGSARRPAAEVDGLFDDEDLFDLDPSSRPEPIAEPSSLSASLPASSTSTAAPAQPGAGPDADPGPAKPTKIGSTAADFAFVEEETDAKDVANWLTFVETRAESRAERARRMRNRLIAGGAALLLVAGGIVTYLWATGSPLLTTTAQPTRDVILLQVANNTSGNAVADAVLVADRAADGSSGATASSGHGAAVLIPSQMVVTGLGSGTQPFSGDMMANPPVPPAGANAVADSLGVQVSAVWSMDETTFAALIDLFGGVTVTTDTAVPAVTAAPAASSTAGPNSAVTSAAIPKGSEKLDGDQALAYALYQGSGESIGTQVNRFGQVLSALLSELPPQEDLVNSYLNQLGVVPDPTLPQAKLAGILAEMASEQQTGQFTVKALPLQNNSTNQLDFNTAGPIIGSLLGGTVQSGLASGGTARVLVDDATGTQGDEDATIQSAASARLISAGYSYVGSSVEAKKSKSVIQIPSGNDESAAGEVAETLNLPTSDIQVVSGMSEISDVTVVLGTDWIQTGENGG
jgi:LytR_cpsA_psr family/LytR cell envelope-related transcriptional attenuator